MDSEIIIRTVKETDFYAIYLLNKNGLGYDYDIKETYKRLKYCINNNAKIFIAEIEKNIVGYIHATDYDCTYCDPLKNIMAIVVDKNARCNGVGKKLINAVENWAKETNSAGVRLVSGYNREQAHKFYIACGYTDRKNQKNFIKIFKYNT